MDLPFMEIHLQPRPLGLFGSQRSFGGFLGTILARCRARLAWILHHKLAHCKMIC